MSDYRRLISYLYAYEGGNKGKNIGYAKLEVREETCRIQISVKKVYVGSSDVGVYLLVSGSEVMLGKIFIRNGAGEFRIQVNAADIEGSGYTMEDCYGLTIHDTQNAWQSYTTIWEDAVSQAAQVQLAEVTAEKVKAEKAEHLEKQELREQQERQELQESQKFPELPISAEIERELELEEVRLDAEAPWDGDENPKSAAHESETQEPIVHELETQKPIIHDPTTQDPTTQAPITQAPITQASATPEPTTPALTIPDPTIPEPEDLAKLEELDRQERETAARRHLWSRLQNLHTKVLAFDYDNGCEILSIKPQDIGLLPREIWIYGNNSFLLHGYYNYRHLILARLNNPQGEPRYLLGVPGHYFSNEKYMASMFGFPHFVLARKQPEGDGRFGYWYTDIRL